ncbi:AraC family transcriptional regulator [Aequorivita sp. SDUM287046]|uniref:AraC family transcriptional regulator n=1 Tax=Aequorivita aurantiaca TaxID=3053356 RepID=A0ABT8DH27_9FLAO|nr:AraC family transcriptional regulator [Aequorivita aurantiaca]MDN3724152.1 AraC family transcriptional regulator [Aequorivita aurantiaca]
MKLHLKYDPHVAMELFIKDLINSVGIPFHKISAFEIQLDSPLNNEQMNVVSKYLSNFNIEITRDHSAQVVMEIKKLIIQMIHEQSTEKTGDYLCRHLEYSYRHLSHLFQKATYCSIESFVIFQKIEMVKKLAIDENLTLTEIAFRLNYCSVAHLSRQFKQTTGLTFQEFQKIISARFQRKIVEVEIMG